MIINYCSGGLGNRLKPLSSCYDIAVKTRRELGQIWKPTMRCGAMYGDLFSGDVCEVPVGTLLDSGSVSIYSYPAWIKIDHENNNDNTMMLLSGKYGVIPLDRIGDVLNDRHKYIIIYSNSYLSGFNSGAFIKQLKPVEELQLSIDSQAEHLHLDSGVIGVHARGTDFEPGGVNVNTYLPQIGEIIHSRPDTRFLACSDSHDYELAMLNAYPSNVSLTDKRHFVHRGGNSASSWVNNTVTPRESVREAVVDIFLLARTDFRIYHRDSSFAHIVNILKGA